MSDHETWGTAEVVCPYCGHEGRDSWELGDSGETDCGECERVFWFERIIDISYTCRKLEGDE